MNYKYFNNKSVFRLTNKYYAKLRLILNYTKKISNYIPKNHYFCKSKTSSE